MPKSKNNKNNKSSSNNSSSRGGSSNKERLLQKDNVHIGIIGGGLAGLSAALAILRKCSSENEQKLQNNQQLQQQQVKLLFQQGKITIYERDPSITSRKEGYGMTITYNPNGPLEKLGILEQIASRDCKCPSRCHYLFDAHGFVKGYFGNAFYKNDNSSSSPNNNDGGDGRCKAGDEGHTATTSNGTGSRRGAGQRGNLRIPRSELRNILLDALMLEAQKFENQQQQRQQSSDNSAGNGTSSVVDIVWNKKLLHYVDTPMMDKLNQIHNPTNKRNETKNLSNQTEVDNNVENCNAEQKDDEEKDALGSKHSKPLVLYFEDGTTDSVDLLIGADGVNSVVARQYLSTAIPTATTAAVASSASSKISCKADGTATANIDSSSATTEAAEYAPTCNTNSSNNLTTTTKDTTSNAPTVATPTSMISEQALPKNLGIYIILGISNHFHPLIDERGFYTLDGINRLFIMPFSGSRLDDADAKNENEVESQNNDEQANANKQSKQSAQSIGQQTNSKSNNGSNATTRGGQRRQRNRRTMWQLSFPISNPTEAQHLNTLSPKEKQSYILNKCQHYHEPFQTMVQNTPLHTIWGTSLLDRDPTIFLTHRQALEKHGRLSSRVVLLGDAAHSMSPFKGQGANMALADGPVLASWLVKSNIDSAVRGFMNEMVQRSGVKVRASREAAINLHSMNCWDWMMKQDYNDMSEVRKKKGSSDADDEDAPITAVFHGVQPQKVSMLLDTLNRRGIGAHLGSRLDETIRAVIHELDIAEAASIPNGKSNNANQQISSEESAQLQKQALEYASTGNIGKLRELSRNKSSLHHYSIIPNAITDESQHQRTCLHLAAQHGHVDVVRWLLSEVNVSYKTLDGTGKLPLDLAVDAGHEEVVRLLKRWMERMDDRSLDEQVGESSILATASSTKSSIVNNGNISSNGGGLQQADQVTKDLYRHVEQQLRGVCTVQQLQSLLRKNRDKYSDSSNNGNDDHTVTHVLGCHLDASDEEYDRQRMKQLAEEHGAVILRNFVPREVDQLALGVIALRPMKFDLSSALDALRRGTADRTFDGLTKTGTKNKMDLSKSEKKRADKRLEEIKSQLTIPSDSSVVTQTNFGPQMQSYSANNESCASKKTKRQKIDSFPLSRLRYVNLGEWNYNWGDRKYEKVPNAMALPNRLVSLANRAYEIAAQQTNNKMTSPQPSFDMAICNLYHLQRPSDRLGGHQDNVESNLSLPLVTISFGVPGVFLLGGNTREDVPTPILLRAGDCMIMSDKSRRYFHGVPTILSNESNDDDNYNANHCEDSNPKESLAVFPELSDSGENHGTTDDGALCDIPSLDEMRFVKAFLTTSRMNMSIRQV